MQVVISDGGHVHQGPCPEKTTPMFKRKNVVLTRAPQNDARAPPQAVQGRGPAPAAAPAAPGVVDTPLIRPSLVDSVPCVTTGSRTLDKALGHGGVPIGTLTLVEEHATTDFAAAVLKSGAATSVASSRSGLARAARPRVICVGIPDWLRALPSVVDPAKQRPRASPAKDAAADRMRIAWRYAKHANNEQTDLPNKYCPDVDFKTTLVPAPQASEVTYILGGSLDELLAKLRSALENTTELVRVVVPSFLHPAVYAPEESDPSRMLPFLAGLKELVQAHKNAVAFVSVPLMLFPRTRSVVAAAELLADTCVELEPFDSGDEKVQGFLHVTRIAKLSDRGLNVEQRRELAFRLGRYQFEVSPYAIPVEAGEETVKDDTSW